MAGEGGKKKNQKRKQKGMQITSIDFTNTTLRMHPVLVFKCFPPTLSKQAGNKQGN